jgi:hypothetical protein
VALITFRACKIDELFRQVQTRLWTHAAENANKWGRKSHGLKLLMVLSLNRRD